ncbi:MAG: cusR [Variovorax sp.]|nr:cusR [Variovorax sp.]
MRILLIEDDLRTASYLIRAFRESGHLADHASDGATGLVMARDGMYDALVLDRMLPALDGLQVVQVLRREGDRMPILMLSAWGATYHRVEGLKAGCDDYLPKPFAFVEVLARLEGLLDRAARRPIDHVLRVNDLELNLHVREAKRGDRPIVLNLREFLLLERLMRHPGRIVTRAMLLECAWDYDFEPPDNLIDKHMHRLRKKIDADADEVLIHTARGIGYSIGARPAEFSKQ